ncbi:pyridoxamine 5'-phosphate oxidase [Alkalispirochaeta americana]|uniref:Pyridoxamine 5'-phosphate oxidase n=1 Tax=Alkalispirochaeta americana TaxID=159291 RepID=A0A1N6NYP2_9SPIO|nr:pyridoxamine 5'-phosphate oxidase family protein [Alkalispirochaeta americana]SIP97126.1 pyridoxamine 5'-phosphate oxidase [Alkalispirochaeta americana]
MKSRVLLDALERVLDSSGRAVMATVDEQGIPRLRWMVAGMLRGAPGYVYAVTSPGFRKVKDLEKNPGVSWMFQDEALDEIVHLRGEARVVDNPSLKADVLEAIGKDLANFWRANAMESDLVVIETVPDEIEVFSASRGDRVRGSLAD